MTIKTYNTTDQSRDLIDARPVSDEVLDISRECSDGPECKDGPVGGDGECTDCSGGPNGGGDDD